MAEREPDGPPADPHPRDIATVSGREREERRGGAEEHAHRQDVRARAPAARACARGDGSSKGDLGQIRYNSGKRKIQTTSTRCQYSATTSTGLEYRA